MNKPTEDGWYWLKIEYKRKGATEVYLTTNEVVKVCMKYPYRNQPVPHVIGLNWRGPLSSITNTTDSIHTFSSKITPPEGFKNDIC